MASLSPEEKVSLIEKQMRAVERNDALFIICPYCGEHNYSERERLCCSTFGKATLAILKRWAAKEVLDTAYRTIEAASRN